MSLRSLVLVCVTLLSTSAYARENFTIVKDLRADWMTFVDGSYQPAGDIGLSGLKTIYFRIDAGLSSGRLLRIYSNRLYFLFVNGKVRGEYTGEALLDIDSLARAVSSEQLLVAVHQDRINERDLQTTVLAASAPIVADDGPALRPYSPLRDFVVVAGLLIMLLFVVELRLNPKLSRDYLSLSGIFSSREVDDSQAGARLTSGANVQFYILCSLIVGLYLLIVLYHLPPRFALPLAFRASGFWPIGWQWVKLSAIVFSLCMAKLLIIYSTTRLFGMGGMTRFHFFNWMRLLLLTFGAAVVVLFIYFISHGDNPKVFVAFLSVVVAALIAWIVLALFKLTGRSGHSLFHLFSYLCTTEIIPLLIVVKVLFQ